MIIKIVCRDKISIMKKWIYRKVAGDRTVGDATRSKNTIGTLQNRGYVLFYE